MESLALIVDFDMGVFLNIRPSHLRRFFGGKAA